MNPIIHITNWSSRKLHHGTVHNIMAKPRAWERGCGNVLALTPPADLLTAAKCGEISLDVYRAAVVRAWADSQLSIRPGALYSYNPSGGQTVISGDTLCCSCAKSEAAQGRCHRVWAATFLKAKGWDVVLDGVAL